MSATPGLAGNGGAFDSRHNRFARGLVGLLVLAVAGAAQAVPSYARQTGMACTQCHTLAFGPALTSFGRTFKLLGYTLGTERAMPFSAMLVSTSGNTAKRLPEKAERHFDDNNNVALGEIGLFYAGKLSEHIGAFAQVTYSGISRDVAWDNVDVRWAMPTSLGTYPAVVGISVNNSPTTQDLWNSTPVWSAPSIGSDLVPTPGAAPLIIGALGEQVVGATAYTMINDHFYLEGGVYHGVPNKLLDYLVGTSLESPRPKDLLPYWRGVYQISSGAHYYSAGVFGIMAKLQPGGSVGGSNSYRDVGVDSTYAYASAGPHAVNVNVSYIRENQRLKQSFFAEETAGVSQQLNALHLDIAYVWKKTWSASAAWFDTKGAGDTGLYVAEPVVGSASGRPDSRGYTLQLDYVPWGQTGSFGQSWANMRVGLQYTAYNKFNGGDRNYDGFGRDASDNDTLLLFVWLSM